MKTYKLLSIALIGVIAIAGCSTTKSKFSENPEVANAKVEAQVSGAGEFIAFDESGEIYDELSDVYDVAEIEVDQVDNNLNDLTFYFGFDKSNVDDGAYTTLASHAKYLSEHPESKVRVEGHTDERGSREYNVALGERRAQAISRILLLDGVNKDQIALVSYGQEKPAVQGHDEIAWAKNRRALIVYEAS